MYKNDVEMRIQVNGRAVREFQKDGLTFIEARNGTNYTIKIKNNGASRVMAIVSVDGLDVITGKPAEKSATGYVVDGYSATEIKGYRVTDDSSAAFVFVSKDASYTVAATGTSQNAGVIGVRVYKEKAEKKPTSPKIVWPNYVFPSKPITPIPLPTVPQWPDPNGPTWVYGASPVGGVTHDGNLIRGMSLGGNSTSAGKSISHPSVSNQTYCCSVQADMSSGTTISANACNVQPTGESLAAFDTGTTWGQSQSDKVKHIEFRRGTKLAEMVVYYATKEALVSMGVDLSDTPAIAATKEILPQAFGQNKYCKPPKGWQG